MRSGWSLYTCTTREWDSEDARSSCIRPWPPMDRRATISSAIGDALLPLAPTPRQPHPLFANRRWDQLSRVPMLRGRASDKRHPYVPAAHHPQHPSSPSSCAPSTETASPNCNVLLSCSQLHLYYRSSPEPLLGVTLIQALQASPVIRCMEQTCTVTTRKGRTCSTRSAHSTIAGTELRIQR
ncbi:hypothetical protein B0H13DRAFT_2167535 [Mycena leptocephala]|nr:hypothetical protein B0H13DRAFT_2167535 [Mycena leptocephala]